MVRVGMGKLWTEEDGCWVWMGTCSDQGTPMMHHEGRMVSARRLLYKQSKGIKWLDRRTKVVKRGDCHPKCVNPAHCSLRRNHEVNEAFLENYGAHRRRRIRENMVEKIERLEKARKKWSI